jgi:methionyl-tRNA synthetase
MSHNKIYLTTPIYYVNAEPHIGHAYTTTIADALKKYYQLTGQNAYLLTGTDEHGEKIQKNAEKKGLTPLALADEVSAQFRATWDEFGIEYDDFIRTTEERHKKYVRDVLQKVYDKGDISLREYEGNYCVGCERFLRESELVNGLCPDHQTAPEPIKEKNYFFQMSKYADALKKYLSDHPDLIRPQHYTNDVLSFLNEGIGDLCISRPKSRVSWGIELPFDTDYVTYVWFDALLNYVSALGGNESDLFQDLWPNARHLVGKDILKTHAIYWPTMLMSAGLPIFQHLDVHGFWLSGGGKMSKTVGNVVKPQEIAKKYGVDAMRYFMLREMRFGLDANFTEALMASRYESDLANGLGNLVNRVSAMVNKYFYGMIPKATKQDKEENELVSSLKTITNHYQERWENYEMNTVLTQQWDHFSKIDRYINNAQPWALAKDEGKREKLGTVLATILECLRIHAFLILPVMPKTTMGILSMMNEHIDLSVPNPPFEELTAWGKLQTNTKLSPLSPLFPRIP